ncbi:MAG: PmoA family protein [Planctomycetota bacterium]
MLRDLCVAVLCSCLLLSAAGAAEVTLDQSDDGVTVKVDGQLFTKYLIKSGTKPILYPILGPSGDPLTRAYPMEEREGEKTDHVHHRSLWFSHGDVGGADFWMEEAKKKQPGQIEHREFVEVAAQPVPTIVTRNDWIAPTGEKVCEDVRTLRFGADESARWIDFDIEIQATDEPVVFGDTKEGTFAIRVAEPIRVEAKKGGQIVNSEGQRDAEAWGKRASWVDYHGPVEGATQGIAILNHPTSFGFPTYWHVRTYGLFAANPFGAHDFTGNESESGAYTLEPGKPLTLRYRVILHNGDEKAAKIAERFEAYTARN